MMFNIKIFYLNKCSNIHASYAKQKQHLFSVLSVIKNPSLFIYCEANHYFICHLETWKSLMLRFFSFSVFVAVPAVENNNN